MENGNGHNGKYTAAQFIAAMPGSGGIISTIAKRIGCSWHTAKKYINDMPTIRQAYDDECSRIVDLAESVLIRNMEIAQKTQKEKEELVDTSDARWYLARKAKDRGFSERHEIDLRNIDLSQLTEYQLQRLANGDGLLDVLTTPGES